MRERKKKFRVISKRSYEWTGEGSEHVEIYNVEETKREYFFIGDLRVPFLKRTTWAKTFNRDFKTKTEALKEARNQKLRHEQKRNFKPDIEEI